MGNGSQYMSNSDIDRALDALTAIPPDLDRDDWLRVGMAAQAAGIKFEEFDDWSRPANNYLISNELQPTHTMCPSTPT